VRNYFFQDDPQKISGNGANQNHTGDPRNLLLRGAKQ
jgi:hypothetical protein